MNQTIYGFKLWRKNMAILLIFSKIPLRILILGLEKPSQQIFVFRKGIRWKIGDDTINNFGQTTGVIKRTLSSLEILSF